MLENLRDKLRKLEILFANSGATEGEKAAAGAARERLIKKLEEARATDKEIEMNFYLRDMWQRKLFVALCRRYNLKPFRYYRQKHTTVVVKAPESFIHKILWPEFEEMNKVLTEYLEETTNKIIQQEICESTEEAEVISDTLQLEDSSSKEETEKKPEERTQNLNFESLKQNKDKIARNKPCPCGSGKKYKKCCMNKAKVKQFA